LGAGAAGSGLGAELCTPLTPLAPFAFGAGGGGSAGGRLSWFFAAALGAGCEASPPEDAVPAAGFVSGFLSFEKMLMPPPSRRLHRRNGGRS
jgi:hypothetical protein